MNKKIDDEIKKSPIFFDAKNKVKIRGGRSKMKNQRREKKNVSGITLVALVVTIVVDLVSYDKNRKYSNLVGFSL